MKRDRKAVGLALLGRLTLATGMVLLKTVWSFTLLRRTLEATESSAIMIRMPRDGTREAFTYLINKFRKV